MLQPAKGLGVDNPIPIPLKRHPDVTVIILFQRPAAQRVFI
jgi:hypothetical protein